MRALWAFSIGVAMSLVLGAGVASAAPGQSSWESGPVNVFDQCTGEQLVGTFETHFVDTNNGHSHFNLQSKAIGQTTGTRYMGSTVSNGFFHALPDGNFMLDQIVKVRIVSQGRAPNSIVFAIHIHQVLDPDFNVISGFVDVNPGSCQGS